MPFRNTPVNRRHLTCLAGLLLGVIVLLGHPASAQKVLDTYGGLVSYNGTAAPTCANSTGHFILSKVGNHWWWCTPDDNGDGNGHIFFANQTTPLLAAGVDKYFDCRTEPTAYSWSLLPAGDPLAPAGYTATPGTNAIYKSTVTWYVDRVWADWVQYDNRSTSNSGNPMTKAASVAAMTATKTWYFDTTSKILYVRLAGNDDPTTHVINAAQDSYRKKLRKYKTSSPTALNAIDFTWQEEKRMQAYGFNSISQLSDPSFKGYYTCNTSDPNCTWPGGSNPIKFPFVGEVKAGVYAGVNLKNYATGPVKNIIWGVNGNYTGYRATLTDGFDDNLRQWWEKDLQLDSIANLWLTNSPWLMGMYTDDSDDFWGSGAGPDFATQNPSPNVSWLALISSPVIAYAQAPKYTSRPEVFLDTRNYSKANATPGLVHGTCSITDHPCSLRDYLYDKYSGDINALNDAWGSYVGASRAYTSFDSTGVQVTNEQPTGWTGDGSTKTFTATLAHHPLSPLSVQFSVNGVIIGGDCPWFGSGCSTSTTNTGTLGSKHYLGGTTAASWAGGVASYTFPVPLPPLPIGAPLTTTGFTSGGPGTYNVTNAPIASVNTTTGVVTVAMATDPGAVGTQGSGDSVFLTQTTSTINYSTGAVTLTFAYAPASGSAIKLNYIYGGWMSGGTGLMDEDGTFATHPWVGTNWNCMTGPNPDFPAYKDYFLCTGSGSGTYKAARPSNAFEITNITVSGGTGTATIIPSSTGARTLHEGQKAYITLTSVAACNAAAPVTIHNTGDTATTFTFTAPAGCTNATGGWANGAFGQDIDEWAGQLSANYFKVLRSEWVKVTDIPFLGLDTIGAWFMPANRYFIQGATPHLDGGFLGGYWTWLPSAEAAPATWQYNTRYFGDKPLMNFQVPEVLSPGGAYYCSGRSGSAWVHTQEERGQAYRDALDALLNTPSYNNTYQLVGVDWWEWQDQGIWENFGVVSPNDNAYDGFEATKSNKKCGCSAADPNCSTPLYTVVAGAENSCGGESYDYGDAVTYIKQANDLWLTAATGATPVAAAPAFSPTPAVVYATGQNVSITSATGGAAICYTTNGATPAADGNGSCTAGTTYTIPFLVSSTTTIKALATAAGYQDSAVETVTYTITPLGPSVSTVLKGVTVKGVVIK